MVSRSPEDASSSDAIADYRNGWSALSQLIGEGKSFSGRERDCAFLNLGGERFANVSAASGLNLQHDGRAVAVTDWDYDGRLDFWVTARTAPRLRLLHNQTGGTSTRRFLAIQLEGTSSNRDAIGARIEMRVNGESSPRIRTIRAGDGFLAQSAKRAHWGLVGAARVDSITVRWPGGETVQLQDPPQSGFHKLRQGDSSLEPVEYGTSVRAWTEWRKEGLADDAASATSNASTMRSWIIGRVPFPESEIFNWEGEPTGTLPIEGEERPTLINLWSQTCLPCLAELREWTQNARRIEETGLRVVALNVDAPSSSAGRRAKLTLQDMGFPFQSFRASPGVVEAMEIVHRGYIEMQQPLPAPTSFLLDDRGRVAAIYKGPVSVDQMVRDVALLDQPLETQRDASVPYQGRWASNPFPPNPISVAEGLIAASAMDRAIDYLRSAVKNVQPNADGQFRADSLEYEARLRLRLGDLLFSEANLDEAATVYAALVELTPSDYARHQQIGERMLTRNQAEAALRHLRLAAESDNAAPTVAYNLGLANLALGRLDPAIAGFQSYLESDPEDLAARYQLGNAYLKRGNIERAIDAYERCVRLNPQFHYATQGLAWLLATDASARDGARAVALARTLVETLGRRDPGSLHTLAAALAANRQFSEAIAVIDQALQAAGTRADGRAATAELARARKLYENDQPITISR